MLIVLDIAYPTSSLVPTHSNGFNFKLINEEEFTGSILISEIEKNTSVSNNVPIISPNNAP